jgi:hypothetical protein
MIALIADRPFAVINGLWGTPLQAGHALFAVMQPEGTAVHQPDIFNRTHSSAHSAACAVIINHEIGIRVREAVNDNLPH